MTPNIFSSIFHLPLQYPTSSVIHLIFFLGSIPIMFLQVAQASYNNNEKPDKSAVLG